MGGNHASNQQGTCVKLETGLCYQLLHTSAPRQAPPQSLQSYSRNCATRSDSVVVWQLSGTGVTEWFPASLVYNRFITLSLYQSCKQFLARFTPLPPPPHTHTQCLNQAEAGCSGRGENGVSVVQSDSCLSVRCLSVRCLSVHCLSVHCLSLSAVLVSTDLVSAVLVSTVLMSTVLVSAVLVSTVLVSAVLVSTVLVSTVLVSTVLVSTVLVFTVLACPLS